ncbi:MAG: beta-galactosidase [Candidatus Daviesbacteria bacterium]|nr:beta-galactosidase [Candidatus Daviesbacteria bacterium]
MFKLKTVLKFLILVFVLFTIFNAVYQVPFSQKIEYGVTFSPRFARYLKLDWKKTYQEMLDELKVKNVRLTSYWDILQPEQDKFDFSETDYLLSEAEKRGVRVILVLGERQPRWPECHIPIWAKDLKLKDRQKKILEFIQKTVERYKNYPSVWAWQVENEPFLSFFGEGCDKADENFLKTEISLVRSLSNKKIIISDSGELGTWVVPMQASDIFGTTIYRKVKDKFFGYVTYPVPPYFYSLKSGLIRKFFAPYNQKTIIVELQSEPWLAGGDLISQAEQSKIFSVKDFKNYINFAGKTGFDEIYLWGVEWWYFMDKQGYPQYLDYAKTLFRSY